MMSGEFGFAITCLVAVPILFFAWRHFQSTGRGDFDLEESLGSVGTLDVGIAFDGRRRFVELTIPYEGDEVTIDVHTYLTSSQARLLAEWVRIAATPGRTLADARRRTDKVTP
jgi:hypothetical protein